MIHKLAVASLLVVAAYCQDCSSPTATRDTFGHYLNCIKEGLDQRYGTYEDELRTHAHRAAGACFASSIPDGNRLDRCVLQPGDLEHEAWGAHGPLHECSICRTFASAALKAIKSTPAEDQKCIRSEITKAIAREASHCIRMKIPGFPGVPDIPDLEEGSFQFKDSVISTLSDHIIIQSRLNFCGNRNAGRAASTRICLANPFVGYLSEHCKVIASCDARLAVGNCAQTVPATRQATCECITTSRDELKKRIASINTVFNELLSTSSRNPTIGTSSKTEICVANIKKQMITPVNDWVTVIDGALSNCIKNKPAGQNLGMEAMLNVGCRKVLADTTGAAQNQLKTGFDFVNNLIDAMVERSGRFCSGAHCLNQG